MPATTTTHSEYSTPEKAFSGQRKDSITDGLAINGASSYEHSSDKQVQQVTALRDVAAQVTTKSSSELSQSSRELLHSEKSVEEFLDFIASLRLRYMPHRGSKWDRVLQWAEFFASSVHHFQTAVQGFVPYSEEAARLLWGNSRVLLELGPQHLDLLTKAFAVFYNTGLALSDFVGHTELFSASGDIQQLLASAFADLLRLVTDVTVHYSNSASSSSVAEFDIRFGQTADAFFAHKEAVYDAFWSYQLHAVHNGRISVSIQDIRRFLSANDRTVEILLSNRLGVRSRREEYTCEWFDTILSDFLYSKDKVLVASGKPGSGKSVLAEWIVERLQRQQGRNRHDVLSFFIQGDIQTETSSLNVAKNLLLQLFDRSVGDVELYQHIAALSTSAAQDDSKVEKALWDAIEVGLKDKRTAIVIDGLDQLAGGDDASVKLLNRLHQVTSKHSTTRAIILSQPLKKPGSNHARLFSIESKHIQEDLERVIRSTVTSSFPRLSAEESSSIIQRLASSADGSFAQAILILESVKREKTHVGIIQALDSAPKTLSEAVQKLLYSLDLGQKDTRSILAWLLAAQRPLTVIEIKELLALDTANLTRAPRFTDIESDIRNAVGPLVRTQDGIVRFTHLLIRQQLLELASSVKDFSNKDTRFPFNIQEAHYDLVNKSLAYAKISLTEHIAPSIEPVPQDKLTRVFHKHPFLEYTVRYWASHFLNSPMYRKDGKHKITSEFKNVFPSSATLAVLEYSSWDPRINTQEALILHGLALHLRQTIIADQQEAIFQSLVAVAYTNDRLSKSKEASEHYYQAYKVGLHVFGQSSNILAAVVAGYIQSTQSTTLTAREESANIREELLQYFISFLKKTRGASDPLTIKYTRSLAELYQQIKEVDRAIEIQRELYEMSIEHYGRQHSETISIYKSLVHLLKENGRTEELTQHEFSSYESSRHTLSLTDQSLITAAVNIVSYYESLQQLDKAEQVLVELWQAIAQASQSRQLSVLQDRKIQISLEYVKYLERHQRKEDAQSVLIGLWSEYEDLITQTSQTSLITETVLTSVLTVGRKLQQYHSLTTAENIFKSLFSYYKRTEQQNSSIAIETAISLSETSKEIVETTLSSTTIETSEGESVLEETFESILTIATTTTTSTAVSSVSIQSSIVSTAETLSSLYVRQERWSDAISILIKALQVTWSSVLTGGKVSLPSHDHDKAITLAKRLALSYFKQRRISKAEQIHVNVFQATKALKVQDNLLITAASELIEFYETIYQFEKAIDVLAVLYTLQKEQLKPDNATTISTAYRLAKFSKELHRTKDAEKYFFEIVSALDNGQGVIKWDAVEAALALSSLHVELQHWEPAKHFYGILWKTFLAQGEASKWTDKLAERIYYGYFDILDKKIQVEYKTLLQVTSEFREQSLKLFGENNELTTKATLQLASVYERSEEHRELAIATYEKATSSKTTSTTQTAVTKQIVQAKQRLAHLYATHTSTSTKAISLYTDEYKRTVSTNGYASRQSLQQLTELITSYDKQGTQESTNQALELLQTSITQIAVTEKDSQKLFASAQSIAKLYLQLNQKETALNLLRELRRQVITEEYDSKVSVKGADRQSFLFIVAFEASLLGVVSNSLFSELMATLVTERLLFQNYSKAIKSNAKFDIVFSHGSRLALFYHQKQRLEDYKKVEADLFKRFASFFQAPESSKVLVEFFNISIEYMGKNGQDSTVVSVASNNVFKYIEASKFKEGHELAIYIEKFLHLYDGYRNQQNIEIAFKLSLWTSGRGTRKSTDKKLHQQLLNLSASILHDVLEAMQRLKVKFTDLSLTELNELVSLLGEQQNYEALEMILSDLWSSRHGQAPWSSATVVDIGKRLVEVRFILPGRREQAIHLAEVITYNLRRVWGIVDGTTLEMFRLLASLYTADGNYRQALDIHEQVLRGVLTAVNEEDSLTPADGAQIAVTHLELLKRAYLRLGGWNKDATSYGNLYTHLKEAFQGEKVWDSSALASQGIEWNVKEKADDLGVWKQPASFEFLSKAHKTKHENNLRRTSGLLSNLKYRSGDTLSSVATQQSSASASTSQQAVRQEKKIVHSFSTQGGVDGTGEFLEGGPVGGVQVKIAAKDIPEEVLKDAGTAVAGK